MGWPDVNVPPTEAALFLPALLQRLKNLGGSVQDLRAFGQCHVVVCYHSELVAGIGIAGFLGRSAVVRRQYAISLRRHHSRVTRVQHRRS